MKEIMKKGQNIRDKKRLFFKVFCFIHPERVMYDSIEATFMFEQVSLVALSDSMVIKKFNCLELAQKIHASRN